MRVKKYIVDSMPEALILIKKELGQDAVILDQKKIKVGGFLGFFAKNKLEVIAAVEPRIRRNAPPILEPKISFETQNELKTQPTLLKTQQIIPSDAGNLDRDSNNVNNKQNKNTNEEVMYEEIKDIKNMFMKMLMNNNNDDVPDNIKKVYNHLIKKDIQENIVNELISKILDKLGTTKYVADEHIHEILENEIEKIIDNHTKRQTTEKKQQVYAFVGPTGVGKTTTIAKLAAYYVLEKKVSVGFITADTYRISAVDQLRTYANILNIPVEIVINHEDMKNAINKLQNVDIILIDTAGRNYKNDMHVNELKSLLSVARPDEIYLVLSMMTKQKDMHEITNCFKDVSINSFIFTKIDETSSYGSILNMIKEHNKSLYILTNGQNVPEDLIFIDSKKIAKLIVGESYE